MKKIVRYVKEDIISIPDYSSFFRGKTILIVAATSDIGVVIARSFANSGADIFVTGRSNEKLSQLFDYIPSSNRIKLDIKETGSIEGIFDREVFSEKKIDYVINCAGLITSNERNGLFSVSENEWNDSVDVNLYSNVDLYYAYKKHCELCSNDGTLLIISSIDGTRTIGSLYGSSKSLLNYFIKDVALNEETIKIFGIAPGPVATKMMGDDYKKSYYRLDHPDSRCAVPQDVSNIVLETCALRDALKCGTIVKVDGGYTL